MFSKGKKINYKCPGCGSSHIKKTVMYRQNSYECLACNTWGPWRDRIKVSIKKTLLKEHQSEPNSDYSYIWTQED